MDIVLDEPRYAIVGKNMDIKARVIAILRPKELLVSTTDSWVIAILGGNIHNDPKPYISQMMVTRNYQFVDIANIPESSIWKTTHNFGETTTLHQIIVHPSHSVHNNYWHCNVFSANIPAFHNNQNTKLIVLGILIPAFIREFDVDAIMHLYLTGYIIEKDHKVKLLSPIGPVILDDIMGLDFKQFHLPQSPPIIESVTTK